MVSSCARILSSFFSSYSELTHPCALAFLLRILADLSISATDSGIFLLSVSGSMSEKRPAVTEKMPKMIAGYAALASPCPVRFQVSIYYSAPPYQLCMLDCPNSLCISYQ